MNYSTHSTENFLADEFSQGAVLARAPEATPLPQTELGKLWRSLRRTPPLAMLELAQPGEHHYYPPPAIRVSTQKLTGSLSLFSK